MCRARSRHCSSVCVPLGAATRLYVDELGRLNQRIAALSTQVTMMVAGLPLALKTPAAA